MTKLTFLDMTFKGVKVTHDKNYRLAHNSQRFGSRNFILEELTVAIFSCNPIYMNFDRVKVTLHLIKLSDLCHCQVTDWCRLLIVIYPASYVVIGQLLLFQEFISTDCSPVNSKHLFNYRSEQNGLDGCRTNRMMAFLLESATPVVKTLPAGSMQTKIFRY